LNSYMLQIGLVLASFCVTVTGIMPHGFHALDFLSWTSYC
jgi:hypothetical protein